MKEKFNFIYKAMADAIVAVNNKKLSIEQAKAVAALAKQANNVLAEQINAAKFLANNKDARTFLTETGLHENTETDES